LKDNTEEAANQGKQKQLPLMQQELLYDEAFTIVKASLATINAQFTLLIVSYPIQRFLEQST
jgi:hypothetical protein